ncbi:hypothetical protein [Dendronalium sp. ChiSLP03b]|uniref:hypothetical protein n=1 Tax=Dendronalium sp. ChiSLP03b TaxID=3075381 RepID=UPI002AD3EAC7|nr:hypothetical protein [Dendronalium sp. ChiSLP03b]MDZ8205119.1 hypothetical protein [Dendronalium sp. ChiSLP03b]
MFREEYLAIADIEKVFDNFIHLILALPQQVSLIANPFQVRVSKQGKSSSKIDNK